ncbi:MAG: hypothetical protein KA275_05895 [Chitinophagaceae bacterium]|nr:hypothetical protein [Chitinophagaceae bacterium]
MNSIDKLFKEKLQYGEERLNLGAWANMERLLDQDKTKKPMFLGYKKLISMLLILLATSGTIIGSLYALKHFGKENNNIVSNKNNIISTKFATQNKDVQNEINPIVKNNSVKIEQQSTENERNDAQKVNVASASKNVAKNHPIVENQLELSKASNNSSKKNIAKEQLVAKTSTAEKNNVQKNTGNINDNKKKNKANTTISGNELLAKNETNSKKELDKFKVKNDTFAKVEITKTTNKNEYGEAVEKYDTFKTGIAVIERIEKIKTQLNSNPEVSNPRYVALNENDEKNAQKITIDPNSEFSVEQANEKVLKSENETTTTVAKKDEIAINSSKAKQGSFYGNFYQKLTTGLINLRDKRTTVYTGIKVGVNSSIFSKNNFGGFNAGFSALTPLNNYLQFLTEVNYYHKNNSGYSVNDVYGNLLNYTKDNHNVPLSTIHTYQYDSMVNTYNFKNFSSVEMPLILNASIKKFQLYGGLNLVYNIRMNISQKSKTYVLNYSDTILNSNTSYTARNSVSNAYSANDFKSRFGLGYTFGANYNFTPRIYLDARMSKAFWQNDKTASSKKISNIFYNTPNFQLSLGFRFKNFEREDDLHLFRKKPSADLEKGLAGISLELERRKPDGAGPAALRCGHPLRPRPHRHARAQQESRQHGDLLARTAERCPDSGIGG